MSDRAIEVVLNDRLGKKIRVKCNPDDTIGDLKKLAAAHLEEIQDYTASRTRMDFITGAVQETWAERRKRSRSKLVETSSEQTDSGNSSSDHDSANFSSVPVIATDYAFCNQDLVVEPDLEKKTREKKYFQKMLSTLFPINEWLTTSNLHIEDSVPGDLIQHMIIEHTAQVVLRAGDSFEFRLKLYDDLKERFCFLSPDSPLHPFYQFLKTTGYTVFHRKPGLLSEEVLNMLRQVYEEGVTKFNANVGIAVRQKEEKAKSFSKEPEKIQSAEEIIENSLLTTDEISTTSLFSDYIDEDEAPITPEKSIFENSDLECMLSKDSVNEIREIGHALQRLSEDHIRAALQITEDTDTHPFLNPHHRSNAYYRFVIEKVRTQTDETKRAAAWPNSLENFSQGTIEFVGRLHFMVESGVTRQGTYVKT